LWGLGEKISGDSTTMKVRFIAGSGDPFAMTVTGKARAKIDIKIPREPKPTMQGVKERGSIHLQDARFLFRDVRTPGS
jgi:hypothetical protein